MDVKLVNDFTDREKLARKRDEFANKKGSAVMLDFAGDMPMQQESYEKNQLVTENFDSLSAKQRAYNFTMNVYDNEALKKNGTVRNSLLEWYWKNNSSINVMRKSVNERRMQLDRGNERVNAEELSIDEAEELSKKEKECKPDLKSMQGMDSFRVSYAKEMKNIDDKIYYLRCKRMKLLYSAGTKYLDKDNYKDDSTFLKTLSSVDKSERKDFAETYIREKTYAEIRDYYYMKAKYMSSVYFQCLPARFLFSLTPARINAYFKQDAAGAFDKELNEGKNASRESLRAFFDNLNDLRNSRFYSCGEDFDTLLKRVKGDIALPKFYENAIICAVNVNAKKEADDESARKESKSYEDGLEQAEKDKLDKAQKEVEVITITAATSTRKKNSEGAKKLYQELFKDNFYKNIKKLLSGEDGKIKGEIKDRLVIADEKYQLADALKSAIAEDKLTTPDDLVQTLINLNERAYLCLEKTKREMEKDLSLYGGNLSLRDDIADYLLKKHADLAIKGDSKAYVEQVESFIREEKSADAKEEEKKEEEKKEEEKKEEEKKEEKKDEEAKVLLKEAEDSRIIYKKICGAFNEKISATDKFKFKIENNMDFWKNEEIRKLFYAGEEEKGQDEKIQGVLKNFEANLKLIKKLEAAFNNPEAEFYKIISSSPLEVFVGDKEAVFNLGRKYADLKGYDISWKGRIKSEVSEENKVEEYENEAIYNEHVETLCRKAAEINKNWGEKYFRYLLAHGLADEVKDNYKQVSSDLAKHLDFNSEQFAKLYANEVAANYNAEYVRNNEDAEEAAKSEIVPVKLLGMYRALNQLLDNYSHRVSLKCFEEDSSYIGDVINYAIGVFGQFYVEDDKLVYGRLCAEPQEKMARQLLADADKLLSFEKDSDDAVLYNIARIDAIIKTINNKMLMSDMVVRSKSDKNIYKVSRTGIYGDVSFMAQFMAGQSVKASPYILLDEEAAEKYTEDKKKRNISIVEKAIEKMHHKGVIPSELVSFLAESLYAGKIEEKNIYNEIRYLAGLYKASCKENKTDVKSENKEEQEKKVRDSMSEAMYTFIHAESHKINEDGPMYRKYTKKPLSELEKKQKTYSFLVNALSGYKKLTKEKDKIKYATKFLKDNKNNASLADMMNDRAADVNSLIQLFNEQIFMEKLESYDIKIGLSLHKINLAAGKDKTKTKEEKELSKLLKAGVKDKELSELLTAHENAQAEKKNFYLGRYKSGISEIAVADGITVFQKSIEDMNKVVPSELFNSLTNKSDSKTINKFLESVKEKKEALDKLEDDFLIKKLAKILDIKSNDKGTYNTADINDCCAFANGVTEYFKAKATEDFYKGAIRKFSLDGDELARVEGFTVIKLSEEEQDMIENADEMKRIKMLTDMKCVEVINGMLRKKDKKNYKEEALAERLKRVFKTTAETISEERGVFTATEAEYIALKNYLNPDFTAIYDKEIAKIKSDYKKGKSKTPLNIRVDIAYENFNQFLLQTRGIKYMPETSELKKLRNLNLIEAKRQVKEQLEKKKIDEKELGAQGKEILFENKNPQFRIPNFEKYKRNAKSDYKDVIELKNNVLKEMDEYMAGMTDPGIKAEIADFKNVLPKLMFRYTKDNLKRLCDKRKKYFERSEEVMKIIKSTLLEYFKDDTGNEIKEESKEFPMYISWLRVYLRSEIEKSAGEDKLNEEEWKERIEGYLYNSKDRQAQINDASLKKQREKFLRFERMRAEAKKAVRDETEASRYFVSQRTKNYFESVFDKSSYFEKGKNEKYKKQYEALKDDEKKLFAILLSLPKDIDAGSASIVNGKQMDRIKAVCKSYIEGGGVNEEVNYTAAYNSILKKTSSFWSGEKLEFQAEIFDGTMTLLKEFINKKNEANCLSKEELSDADMSLQLAEKLHNKRQKKVSDKCCESIKDMNSFLNNLKDAALLDAAKTDPVSFVVAGDRGELLGKLNNLKEHELKILVLLLQDRNVLDLEKKESTDMDRIVGHVDEDKRMEIKRLYLKDSAALFADEKVQGENMTNNYQQAFKTLLSFQIKTDKPVEKGKEEKGMFVSESIYRETLIDWQLLKRAMDYIEELVNDRKKLAFVRNAASEEMIKARKDDKTLKRFQAVDKMDRLGAENFLANLNGYNTKSDADAKTKRVESLTDKEKSYVAEYERMDEFEKSLFIKAISNRACLDVSKVNSSGYRAVWLGAERQFVDEETRYDLADEFIRSKQLKMPVAISDEDYKNALKSLFSTQIDDSLDFKKAITDKKLLLADKRTTTIDWKLFQNGLQLVLRMRMEYEQRMGDRALVQGMGNKDQIADYSFDSSYMRRNVHTGRNMYARYFAARARKRVNDILPTKALKTILNLVLPAEAMNSINRSGVLANASKSGSMTAIYREKAVNDMMKEPLDATNGKMKEINSELDVANTQASLKEFAKNKALTKLEVANEKLDLAMKSGDKAQIAECKKAVEAAQKGYDKSLKEWREQNAIVREKTNELSIAKEVKERQEAIIKANQSSYRFLDGKVAKKVDKQVAKTIKRNDQKLSTNGEAGVKRNDPDGGKYVNYITIPTTLFYDFDAKTLGGTSLAALTSKIKFSTGLSNVMLLAKKDSENPMGCLLEYKVITNGEMNDETYDKLAESIKKIIAKEEKKQVLKNKKGKLGELLEKADAISVIVNKKTAADDKGNIVASDEQKKYQEFLEGLENSIFSLSAVWQDTDSDTSAAQVLDKIAKTNIDPIMEKLCGGKESDAYKKYEKAMDVKDALMQVATVIENDIEQLVKGTCDTKEFFMNLTSADFGALMGAFSKYSDNKNLEHISKAVSSAGKTSEKIVALCKLANSSRIGTDSEGIFNPSDNVIETLGVDELFNVVSNLSKCFTDSEMPAEIIDSIKNLTVQGGEVAKLITSYNQTLKERELAGKEQATFRNVAEKDKLISDVAKAVDLTKIGDIIASCNSNPEFKENAALYSGLVDNLKNQAVDIFVAIASQNNKNVKDVFANMNMEGFGKAFDKVNPEKSKAMKTLYVTGRSVAAVASILGGAFAMDKKIHNDYNSTLYVKGKVVAYEGESRDKMINKYGEEQTRNLSGLMSQIGIDDALNMFEAVAKIIPDNKVQQKVVMVKAVEKAVVKITDQIMDAVQHTSRSNIIEAVDLDSCFTIIENLSLSEKIDKKTYDRLKKDILSAKSSIAAIESMFNEEDDTPLVLKLQKIDLDFLTDIMEIKADSSPALYYTVKTVKTAKALMDAGIDTYLDAKGIYEFAKAITNFGDFSAYDTGAFLEKYGESPVFGKVVNKMNEAGVLGGFIRAGAVITENAGNAVSAVMGGINLYKLRKADNEGNLADVRDERNIEESFKRKEEFVREDFKLTKEEMEAVRKGRVDDMKLVTYGMSEAQSKQIDKMVTFVGGVLGSVGKVTVDPTGLVKIAAEEVAAFVNFFRKMMRDKTVGRDALISGPLKSYFNDYRAKHPEIKSDNELAKKYIETYFSRDSEMAKVVGMQVAHAILFAAGSSNPLGGIRIKSQAILNTMGLSNLIGKEGAKAEAMLFDSLMNGDVVEDANFAAASLVRSEPENVVKVSFYRNKKPVSKPLVKKREIEKKEIEKKPKEEKKSEDKKSEDKKSEKQQPGEQKSGEQKSEKQQTEEQKQPDIISQQNRQRVSDIVKKDIDISSSFKPYSVPQEKILRVNGRDVTDMRCWAYSVYLQLQKVYPKRLPDAYSSPDKIIDTYSKSGINPVLDNYNVVVKESHDVSSIQKPKDIKELLAGAGYSVRDPLQKLLEQNPAYSVEHYDPTNNVPLEEKMERAAREIYDRLDKGFPVSITKGNHYYTVVGIKKNVQDEDNPVLVVHNPYDVKNTQEINLKDFAGNADFSFTYLKEKP